MNKKNTKTMLLADDLDQLLEVLPVFIKSSLENHPQKECLTEVVLDIGRRPEARFFEGSEYLSYRTIVWQDLDIILKSLGKFSGDNRAGIEKTLHRISSLRNRRGNVIGLTCRIGRAVFGTVSIIRDLLEQQKSILLLGRPGVGKTTAIREIARVLSMKKRVIIIDTSNEIAGDGDLPHPSIGKARRMQVANHQNQHEVMIEAVENHMPEIIIIDEIGTELEAAAARTIAERGVQLVGTAHGNELKNLIKNPTISDLIGGIQYVTLGDEEAKRRGTSKSILERKAPPTFEIGIEIHNPHTWIIHPNIEQSIDLLLKGQNFFIQQRKFISEEYPLVHCQIFYHQQEVEINQNNKNKANTLHNKATKNSGVNLKNTIVKTKIKKLSRKPYKPDPIQKFTTLYTYGLNIQELKSLIKAINLPIVITKEVQYADAILALANLVKNNKKLKQISHSKNIEIHTIQNNSLVQITKALRHLTHKNFSRLTKNKGDNVKVLNCTYRQFLTPLEETRLIIEEVVIPKKLTVDLSPQITKVRKEQSELIAHYQLKSITVGNHKQRKLRLYPN